MEILGWPEEASILTCYVEAAFGLPVAFYDMLVVGILSCGSRLTQKGQRGHCATRADGPLFNHKAAGKLPGREMAGMLLRPATAAPTKPLNLFTGAKVPQGYHLNDLQLFSK